MSHSQWTPSIIPADELTVYLVADEFGRAGSAWREADLEAADFDRYAELIAGEYRRPIQELWSEDGTSPVKSSAVAICSSASHLICRILSIATPVCAAAA
ncbi:hypothetical protein [Bradyrhizobium sp. WSM2793]|uniref:hypothetical protein n=1 Tax=Bradyrhizobium sp. WSM2793 TaxID=1038866 RepID=UPI0006764575|nr:hypothetical protein [Bradyrhizobium sp. WSM2793]